MDIEVKIDDILEALETSTDEVKFYLDKATGKVQMVTSEETVVAEDDNPLKDYPEWQREMVEVARRLAQGCDKDLIALPTKWDLNDYEIVRAFCESVSDETVRDALCIAIQGSGAFSRFKDAIHRFDVADDWYAYRRRRLKDIAIEWCRANDIEFADDTAP